MWVNRQDPSIFIEEKTPEVLVVDGQVPLKLTFSPEAPSLAPPLPTFVLNWDPEDFAQLPISALIEVVLLKTSSSAIRTQ